MAHILLADDLPLARDSVARALREQGHHVATASDGLEALERFIRERADLVILDLSMPRLSGIEACGRIKALPGPFTPVIFISGHGDLDTRLRALAAGEDFLSKPYDTPELCARVEVQLRLLRLMTEARPRPGGPLIVDTPAPTVLAVASSVSGPNAVSAPHAVSGPHAVGSPHAISGPHAVSAATAISAPSAVTAVTGATATAAAAGHGAASTGGMPDRVALIDRLVEEWRRSAKTTEPMSLVIVGIDGVMAESSLIPLAASIQRCMRSIDVLCRADDRHVAGLLLNTHVTGAMSAVSRLRVELRRFSVDGVTPPVSIGASFHPSREVSEPADLLRLAERAITRARAEGLGRTCFWQHAGYLFDPQDAT